MAANPQQAPLSGLARALVQAGRLKEAEAEALLAKAAASGSTFIEQSANAKKLTPLQIASFAAETFGYPLFDLAAFDDAHIPANAIDRKLIGTSLTLVESLTAVCSAAARHRVDYVLTGGSMHIWGVLDHTAEYAGVDATARNPHFEVVAQSGPYTMRRVPECTPGAPSDSGMPDGEFVGHQLSGAAWPAPSARSAAAQ